MPNALKRLSVFLLVLSHYNLFADKDSQNHNIINKQYDLTIVGFPKFGDGIGRIPLIFIDALKDDLKINWRNTRNLRPTTEELPDGVQKFIKARKSSYRAFKNPGKVALLTDVLYRKKRSPHTFIPKESIIKIAYSMLECTAIPQKWVSILNSKFDLVVVPEKWLVPIYKKSGIKIPIFVLPLGMYLDDFLNKSFKTAPNHPFVFGNLSALMNHKNQLLLIEAFAKAFGNSPDVRLRLNARMSNVAEQDRILHKIKKLRLNNVELNVKPLSWKDYIQFMADLDCYVSFSKGEGYAVIPREALALGIPVILSDNTAHTTLCKSDHAKCIPSLIQESVDYYLFKHKNCYFYNCKVRDATTALRDMYDNYDVHLKKSLQRKNWVKQFSYKNLKKKYLNLIKPLQVQYGKEDKITEDYLMTSSKKLYSKYQKIITTH